MRLAPVLVLIAVRVLFVGAVLDAPDAYDRGTAFQYDAANYHRIAEHDGLPYRDFPVEFPPVSFVNIELVNGPTVASTMERLAWSSVVLDLVVALALFYGWGRRAALAYLVLGLAFVVFPFVYFRIDFLSVALAAWGVALVKRGRGATGGAALAVAAFAKLWPLALVPALFVRRRGRALAGFAATAAAGGIAWLAFAGTAGPEQVLTFRNATGWHVESLVGSVVHAVTGSRVFEESGAIRTGSAPQWATLLLGVVLVGVVVGIWARVARSDAADDRAVEGVAPTAAIAAFLVCSPLLSPQYLIWLLPFAAICWVLDARAVAVMVGLASVLTMVATHFYQDLNAGDAVAHALVLARNGVLVLIVLEGLGVTGWLRRRVHATPALHDGSGRRPGGVTVAA
jgi:hypothetical protein